MSDKTKLELDLELAQIKGKKSNFTPYILVILFVFFFILLFFLYKQHSALKSTKAELTEFITKYETIKMERDILARENAKLKGAVKKSTVKVPTKSSHIEDPEESIEFILSDDREAPPGPVKKARVPEPK